MATAQKQRLDAVVTPRMVEDAYNAAEAALAVYMQAEEVRPGLRLCCRGRLYRALTIAATQPPEKWPALEAETQRLAAIVHSRHNILAQAEQRYRDVCRAANVEPRPSPLEPCACEGCRLEAAALAHLADSTKTTA